MLCNVSHSGWQAGAPVFWGFSPQLSNPLLFSEVPSPGPVTILSCPANGPISSLFCILFTSLSSSSKLLHLPLQSSSKIPQTMVGLSLQWPLLGPWFEEILYSSQNQLCVAINKYSFVRLFSLSERVGLSAATQALKVLLGVTSFIDLPMQHGTPQQISDSFG